MTTAMAKQVTRERAKQIMQDNVVLNAAYIDGAWVPTTPATSETGSVDNEMHTLYDPALGSVVAKTRLGSSQDVDNAVQAAARAYPDWSQSSAQTRAQYLTAIAEELTARFDTLVALSVLNNGKPIAEANIDVSDAIACYRYYAALITEQATWSEVANTSNMRLRKTYAPVGICALITPWNFPMVTTAWKLAPALAAGCTVILKPSEVTLLPELMLGNILSAIDMPKGVVNIVSGAAAVGAAMTSHPKVDKVSFTGSNAVGEKVMMAAAKQVKDISLELGGKSAIIVRADADIEQACDMIIGGIFTNAGQICSATSRLLVHERIAEPLFAMLKAKTERLIIGDGFGDETQMGPLVSAQQYAQVKKYLNIAATEQLDCLTGGEVLAGAGYFVQPTIYTHVPTTSQLWTEEIFGPVLVSTTFAKDKAAIALANDSAFALAATIVSHDETAALEMAAHLQAGHIWINEQQIVLPEAGWGGFKQSGIGRELGHDGLSAYQKSKHVLLAS